MTWQNQCYTVHVGVTIMEVSTYLGDVLFLKLKVNFLIPLHCTLERICLRVHGSTQLPPSVVEGGRYEHRVRLCFLYEWQVLNLQYFDAMAMKSMTLTDECSSGYCYNAGQWGKRVHVPKYKIVTDV